MPPLKNLERYISGLPQGLDSHPEYLMKAALVRSMMEASGNLRDHLDALPGPLAQLVRQPPPVSSWIPEAHGMALQEARRDLLFTSDEAFLADAEEGNRRLLGGVLYGFLFKLVGVERLLNGGASRWTQMHRGVPLALVVDAAQRTARAEMTYPDGLYSRLGCRGIAVAFRAAMTVAGEARARVTLEDHGPRRAVFTCAW